MRKRHVEVSQPPLTPAPGERAAGGGTMDPNTTGEEGTGRGPLLPISTPPLHSAKVTSIAHLFWILSDDFSHYVNPILW